MNSIWNKNLELFKERFPQLYGLCLPQISASQKIAESLTGFLLDDDKGGTASPSLGTIELTRARNGEISAREGGAALHSLYNPGREALNAVSQAEVAGKSSCIFLGTGLGWQIIEFCKKYPQKKLVIIEPDLTRFFSILSLLDWEAVFKQQNLILALACPQESILSLLEDGSRVNLGNTGVSDSYIFDIPAFTAHQEGYFNDIRTIIKRNQRKNEINAATLKKFGKLWVRNSMKNIDRLASLQGISGFRGGCGNLPFLIIGAGPSLEGLLPYLPELKKRMILLCVETALHTLLKAGIQPDFIFLMDPQFWAWRHIAGLRAPESVLITEVSAYPSAFRFPCKKIMLCKSQFPVGQHFEGRLGLDLGDLGTGGSVASAAWNFAQFCGAKKIFTAGLDLSFPSKETHIKGSSAEQTFHTLARRTASVENFTAATLFSANASPAENYLGQKVMTDSRMKMFAWWFEARLAACPQVKTYTLCPQSMKIPGIETAKLEEALSLKEVQAEKEAFLALEGSSPAGRAELEKISRSFPDQAFFAEYPFLKEFF